ncbi:8844_t:CDS:2 [Funneliformis geosporum]|uniref:13633_t:CDS:1 n=1 Tax=Funneliformis geosporum TaxID=1117311 RepID=A0A9W4X4I1_9GLOM|nr:13633_t:CDS:2 [Funneliformis geosporum]CAI2195323.1 8844_t:CDS:2 [Funneliformis geosporum]
MSGEVGKTVLIQSSTGELYLTAMNDSKGSKIQLQERGAGGLQSWILKQINDDTYAIVCLTGGSDFLAVNSNGANKDYTLDIYNNTSNSQQFTISFSDPTYAVFTNANDSQMTSTSNASFQPNNKIGSYNKSETSKWSLIPVNP